MCDIWSSFDGPGSKCSKCQVTKSASIETRETNEVPAWVTLSGLDELPVTSQTESKLELKSSSVEEKEEPYWITLMRLMDE